jgi:hypothetical protein
MDRFMRIELEYGEWVLENECSRAYRAIYTLVRLNYNKCIGYKTKRLCEAGGIIPNNFAREFKKHIEYGTIKKINGLWYINPGHIFYGDTITESYYQNCFDNNILKEPTLEELKQRQNNKDKKIAETKSNKDKLIKQLQEEIKLLNEQC